MAEIPIIRKDLRDRDPEVRKERVKLAANGFNAMGLALVIGSFVAPLLDPTRVLIIWRILAGSTLGVCLIVAAAWLLRYVKPQET